MALIPVVLMVAVALGFGLFARILRQHRTVCAIEALGPEFHVVYDFQIDAAGTHHLPPPEERSPGAQWLRELLGPTMGDEAT